ncbi:hypothetical protein [Kitasatospora purpeofusca]|uniref:hypothetical protein n=1 Tax=Kitasatospora purpeofusca TaxID=67352 RepID=UPI0022556C5D|nr:hypothetical protein [Kitasatospora purpeofusca]MCX4756195.1 hypothetical protein [Kitasatospora purpeofusca]WSR35973.1 hypothetical protein OG715_36485 [Kitasatospora purpeofusca]WSR44264.1 hypothetical protein OG196_37360 [Kitasatospora purpeofusca]
MEVGVNYPWMRNDPITIGPNIHEKGRPHPWQAAGSDLDRNLATLRGLGVTVVRMWLMAHGVNYDGTVFCVSALNGAARWRFEPPQRLHPKFLDDVEELLVKFEKADMRIIPVLLDFGFFDEPEAWSLKYFGPGPPTPTDLNYGRGRRAVAEDRNLRATFVNGTVKPLVAAIAKHRRVVHAVDVVNEPYWCVSPITGALFGQTVNQEALTALMRDCVAAVEAAGLPSTVGHRFHRDIANVFGSVKVTRPQFHYYASLPGVDALPVLCGLSGPRPFLGEFGCITGGELDALQRDAAARGDKVVLDQIGPMRRTQNPWPVLQQSRKTQAPGAVLTERLDWLADFGYELALVWPNAVLPDPGREDLKFDALRRSQIAEFTRRRPH